MDAATNDAENIPDDPKTIAALLKRWRGGKARLWEYRTSLSLTIIRVERPDVKGNLHLICSGTTSISCPIHWKDCDLEVLFPDLLDPIGSKIVRDARAGVEIRCDFVAVMENVQPVF